MKVLTCAAARKRLEAFHDEELAVGEQIAVSAHLDWCEECAARLADLQLIRGSLREALREPVALSDEEQIGLHTTIVSRAKAHKALVAANPRVRQLSSRAEAFRETLAHIDILAVNRSEADVLVPGLVARFGEGGRALPLEPGETPPRLVARGLTGGGHEMSLAAFFNALRQAGPQYVVVTDGRNGAFLGTREAIHYCPAVLEPRVMGTAGAGDAFNTTFTASVALGHRPEDALRAAAVNSASVVRHADTQTGLLSHDELAAQVAVHAEQLAVRTWSQ